MIHHHSVTLPSRSGELTRAAEERNPGINRQVTTMPHTFKHPSFALKKP